jgi:hypothetical protein
LSIAGNFPVYKIDYSKKNTRRSSPCVSLKNMPPLTGENLNRVYQAIQAFAELFGDLEEEKKAT